MSGGIVEIVVPQIGEAVAALRLVSWHKAVGDTIQKGEVLFDVDSDKAIVEVEAVTDGTLIAILSPADSEVMPQQVVGRIEATGERDSASENALDTRVSAVPAHAAVSPTPDSPGNGRKVSPVARRVAEDMGISLENVTGSGPGGRITTGDVRRIAQQSAFATMDTPAESRSLLGDRIRVNASPKAKRLAREAGIDLGSITRGTGVDGMIRAQDVGVAVNAKADAVTLPDAATTSAPTGTDTIPLSKLRQAVAMRTLESKQTIPHFYLMVDVNMTQANRLRNYCRSHPGWDKPPTYTAILIRACGLVLADLPDTNRSYGNHGLLARQSINIGVAVDTDQGLIVPVIPAADKMGLRDVSLALHAASARARKGALKPSDLGEKSMTISNLGMYNVDTFIAIIDPPDPMILAVGRVADRLVPINGKPAIQPICTLTLSVDHRVLDGAQAARFLERVKDRLENPYELMLS